MDVGADLYLDYTNMLRTDDPLAEIFEIINKGNGDMVKQIGLGPYYSRYSHV